MFDVGQLKQDVVQQKRLPVECLEIPDEQPMPVIIIELTDKIRQEQQKIYRRFNRFVMLSGRGKQTGTVQTDKLGYAKAMVDLCVKDSEHLFSENGQPVKHSNELLKTALLRFPPLLDWFLDALTEAFEDYVGFRKEEEEDLEKN